MSGAMLGGEDTGRVHLIPALHRLAGEIVKEKSSSIKWAQGPLWAQNKKQLGEAVLESDLQDV